ncbi:PP2C family serine/threonine-protein phosphatase [Rhodoferax sp.]|uniref:PP2C family protein-serine/threonine phosphatase n=1 Tax=Rhodoferax sp. TaxID=50421 RepID=UPI0025DFCB18|nr:PP2C family serine/threonine-protein phosphatase [Rhodoferax sp.]
MQFSVFQQSRQGGRKCNEDRMGYCYTRDSAVLMLADGLGGHPQGEVAAHLAVTAVANMFQKLAQPKLADMDGFIESAMMAAHYQIQNYAVDKALNDSPRTTLVIAVIQSGHVVWAHCGDSRLYLVRQHQLLARTRDHTFAERGSSHRDKTLPTPAELNRNVLFSCLGSPGKPSFSVAEPVALKQGDKLLLCSDGLWSSLAEQDIVNQLSQKSVETAVPDLVAQALKHAGKKSDNVTCLALAWQMPDTVPAGQGAASNQATTMGHFAATAPSKWHDGTPAAPDKIEETSIDQAIPADSAANFNDSETKPDIR